MLHEGIADGSHSAHITLGIHPYTWSDLIRDVLTELESTDDLFRASATVSPAGFEETLRTISSRLSLQLSSSESIEDLVAARTDRYKAASYRGRFRGMAEPKRITVKTAVRIRAGIEAQLRPKSEEIELCFGTKSIAFPLFVTAHLQIILNSAPITAEELPGNIDDDGKLTMLRRLLAEGVIEVYECCDLP
jgi:hypothetical protein